MILDIDLGNTRMKWILRGGGGDVVSRGAELNSSWGDQTLPVSAQISRVRISSVKGDLAERIERFMRDRLNIAAEFARVVDGVSGLKCGYEDSSRLGVDRWLALLACWENIGREAIVVDAGSALTIDVLSGNRHQGGYIVPGLEMMKRSLSAGTWGISVDSETAPYLRPADNTSDAVRNGSLVAHVGMVDKVVKLTGIERIVLTGGDSNLLKSHFDRDYLVTVVPDLVLDGLAVALP